MTETLDVHFTSNAPAITPGVEKLATATQAVDGAQKAAAQSGGSLASALTRDAAEYRKAAQSAREYNQALRGRGIDAGTGSGESPRVRQLQMEAKALGNRRTLLASIARDGGGSGAAEIAATEKRTIGIQRYGSMLSRLGGVTGRTASGLLQATPALAAFAIGAVAIGVAINTGISSLERYKEQVSDITQRTQALSEVTRQARDEVGKIGLAGADREGPSLRRVIAGSGQAGLDQVAALNKRGMTGAAEGMASAQSLPPELRATAIEAAIKIQKLGEATFSEAVKGIAKNGGIFAGNSDQTAAFQINRADRSNLTGADVGARLAAVDSSATGKNLNAIQGQAGFMELDARNKLPQAVGAAYAARAAQADPLSAALVDFNRQQQSREETLRITAESLGKVGKFFDALINVRDSAQNKYLVEQTSNAAAVFNGRVAP